MRFLTVIRVFLDEAPGRMDRGKRTEVCHVDFQKAFHSNNYMVLEKKTGAFGMDAKVKGWTAQNLRGGTFRVKIKECLSAMGPM